MNIGVVRYILGKSRPSLIAVCVFFCASTDMTNGSFCIWERICSEAVSHSVRRIPDTDCLSKKIAQHVTYVFLYCFSLLEI